MTTNTQEAIPVSYRFMLPIILGTMMNPLNSTMLATALIPLCNSIHISVGAGAILVTSLYVTATIAQPLMGRLADIFSAKKINTIGFILVLIAAIIGALAPNLSWLIVSRIILGLGTSASYPSAMALLNKRYAEVNQPVPGNLLGLVGISAQVSMILGPVLGGLLTQWLGWRGIFLINIPWVLVSLYLAKAIPEDSGIQNLTRSDLLKRLDLPGILIFSLLLLALLYLLMANPFSQIFLLLSFLLLALLIIWERKQEAPFIDVRLLASKPALLFVYIRAMATSYILYSMLYGFPQWLEGVRQFRPAETGLLMLPDSIVAIVIGLLISKSNKLFLQNAVGVFFMLITCGGMFLLNGEMSVMMIVVFTIIMGIAEGLNLIANQALLNAEAPSDQKGISFGLYRTFSYLGAILSGAQLKVLFHTGINQEKFHLLSYSAFYSCLLLALLLLPLLIKRLRLKAI
jgi:MFS family permease